MSDVATALKQDQLTATPTAGSSSSRGGGIAIPAIGNIAARSKDFVLKGDHSLQSTLGIARVFYGQDAGRQWFDSFSKLVSHRYGESDQFSRFILHALPFLKFIRNARNCVEHPSAIQRVVTRDYLLQPDGTILPPSIEVIHPKTPMPAAPLAEFMSQVLESLVSILEQVIVFICSKHVRPPLEAFPIQVVEWPEESRQHNVRYSYGLYDAEGRPIRAS